MKIYSDVAEKARQRKRKTQLEETDKTYWRKKEI